MKLGIHTNLFVPALGMPQPAESEAERAAAAALATFRTSGNGYLIEQNTRPQRVGYALLDPPVALAAWMLDHVTDAYYKISRAFLEKQPSGNLTPDRIVDNITMYWLTGTGFRRPGDVHRSTCRQARCGITRAEPIWVTARRIRTSRRSHRSGCSDRSRLAVPAACWT